MSVDRHQSQEPGQASSAEVVVAAVDDHPVVAVGLRAGLAAVDASLRLTTSAPTVRELLDHHERFDVVLLDLALHDGSVTADNVDRLVGTGARVLIYTGEGQHQIPLQQAMAHGALGVVTKGQPVAEVADAIRTVSRGDVAISPTLAAAFEASARLRPQLSTRERQVLGLYAGGLPAKAVARRLGVEIGTTKVYLRRIRQKYAALERGAASRVELYQRAVEDGFVQPSGDPGPDL